MDSQKIWFPAKKYGWGWDYPCHWMGWVTIFLWITSLVILSFVFPPDEVGLLWYCASIAPPTIAAIFVCYWKGEPPRWRWGK